MTNTAKKLGTAPMLAPGEIAELPLDRITLDPDQPRKDVPDSYIKQLAGSIAATGVRQPITVRADPDGDGWIVVYGECRYRASKQAGKTTIPAQLASDDVLEDPLTRLLAQVSENYHRRDLNAIELAEVLRRLRDDFDLRSHKAMEEALAEHGMASMSRPYISNTLRLLDLPDWAQDLIRAGELTAGHGKFLLVATASDAVLEFLRTRLTEENWRPSTRQLQQEIFRKFRLWHYALDDGFNARFDFREACVKAGCQKMRKVSDGEQQSMTFCLDGACFDQKNSDARQAMIENNMREGELRRQEASDQAQWQEPIVGEGNIVDLREQPDVTCVWLNNPDFDVAACDGCEHFHIARTEDPFRPDEITDIPACFSENEDCAQEKIEAAITRAGLVRKVREGLTNQIRSQIAIRARKDSDVQDMIFRMIAIDYEGCAYFGAFEEIENAIADEEIPEPGADFFLHREPGISGTIAAVAVRGFDDKPIRILASAIGLEEQTAFEPDPAFLSAFTHEHLVDILTESGCYDDSDYARLSRFSNDELIERIIDDNRAREYLAGLVESTRQAEVENREEAA